MIVIGRFEMRTCKIWLGHDTAREVRIDTTSVVKYNIFSNIHNFFEQLIIFSIIN